VYGITSIASPEKKSENFLLKESFGRISRKIPSSSVEPLPFCLQLFHFLILKLIKKLNRNKFRFVLLFFALININYKYHNCSQSSMIDILFVGGATVGGARSGQSVRFRGPAVGHIRVPEGRFERT